MQPEVAPLRRRRPRGPGGRVSSPEPPSLSKGFAPGSPLGGASTWNLPSPTTPGSNAEAIRVKTDQPAVGLSPTDHLGLLTIEALLIGVGGHEVSVGRTGRLGGLEARCKARSVKKRGRAGSSPTHRQRRRESKLMATVRDYKGPAPRLSGTGGQARFAGVKIVCRVCSRVITSSPEDVICERGHHSGPLHSECAERWVCSDDCR